MNPFQEWVGLIRREFAGYGAGLFGRDVLAALTVAAVALPLALAFGVASGADAAAGLVTAILAGVLIGALGGAPYQISGPTGAMSAVLIVLAARHGLQAVWLAGLLAGGMLVLLGLFRLGRVIALIPAPVISGFTSGIALLIAIGQIGNALGLRTAGSESAIGTLLAVARSDVAPDPATAGVTLLVMAILILWPRLPFSGRMPGSLLGIVVATVVVAATGLDVQTIGTIPRSLFLPDRLDLAGVGWMDLSDVLVPAMSIAALGAIESLLCGAVAGNMTGIRLHSSVELVAQGLGNMAIPFFGGVPATAAIARTSVAVKSGGATRVTSILHGIFLLVVVLALAPVISRIPLAALAGVLLVTAWRMNEWHSIRFYFGRGLGHAIVAFLVTLIATIALDLTQAILIGFGISTLIFISEISDLHVVRRPVEEARLGRTDSARAEPWHDVAVYYLSGPLFFAAARKLLEEIEANDTPDATLILSMRGVPLIDATGIGVLDEVLARQRAADGDLLLSGLQPRVELLLQRAGFLAKIGADRTFWSSDRALASLAAADGIVPSALAGAPPRDPGETGEGIDLTLVITPHEDQSGREI